MKKTILTMAFILSFIGIMNAQDLNKKNICKKWHLSHYEHMWIDYDPEAEEKNDYILFKDDMTYESLDGGQKSTGKWSFDAKKKTIVMYGQNEQGSLTLQIEELDKEELVFELVNVEEMDGVDIHYSSQKKL